jgi:hypothetical protein
MSIYSASHQVNDSGHLLDGIARGLLSGSNTLSTMGSWLWPKNLDTTGSLQQQMVGEPYTHTGYGPTTLG